MRTREKEKESEKRDEKKEVGTLEARLLHTSSSVFD